MAENKISRGRMIMIATKMSEFFDKNNIKNKFDLAMATENGGFIYLVEKGSADLIQSSYSPSSFGSYINIFSYLIRESENEHEKLGSALELRINCDLNYTSFILKSIGVFPYYTPFDNDISGNIRQINKIEGSDIDIIKRELSRIARRD